MREIEQVIVCVLELGEGKCLCVSVVVTCRGKLPQRHRDTEVACAESIALNIHDLFALTLRDCAGMKKSITAKQVGYGHWRNSHYEDMSDGTTTPPPRLR